MDAIQRQSLDFAFITPVALVELSLDSNLRVLSTITQPADESFSPWLAGAVFTLESRTDISNLSDVRGKNVIALSELALGGWLSAVREWNDLGINVDNHLNSTEFDFSYSSIISRVCSGEMDIGVIAANTFLTYSSACDKPLKILPQIEDSQSIPYPLTRSTRLYPEVAFVMLSQNDEGFIRELTKVLLDIEPDSEVANAVNICGFNPPLPYNEVQALMEELGIGPFGDMSSQTIRQFLSENNILVIAVLLGIIFLTVGGYIYSRVFFLKLKQSENYRLQLFENSHIPMVVVNHVSRTFHDMNPAALKIYGYENKSELIGQDLMVSSASHQDVDTSIPDAFNANTKKVLEENAATFEWRMIRPNAEEWIAKIHLMKMSSFDEPLVQATIEDITVQKRLEEERGQLEQQLEFSQRMESIGRLAGGIAHDFNNLLTIINGYSEFLIDDSSLGPSQHEIMEQITKAGLRASELTHQLLTFSRKQVVKQIPVNINNIITDSAGMIKSVLGDGINLEMQLYEIDSLVLTDPGQIQQVMINLVVNAKDAMPQGGSLNISTESIFITPDMANAHELTPGNYMEIRVKDNGVGIDKNIINHIFEPFFTTKESSGTGLGLSSVYGIIRQSKGTILVESKKDKGALFKILLPVTETKEYLPDELIPENFSIIKDCTVLVVEDQKEVRTYIVAVLEKAGYQVISAESGEEAITIFNNSENPFHLLITDVVMEGMNGGELAAKLLELHPEIPVLFTSGYPENELTHYDLKLGTLEFLAKPFSPKELLSRLGHILGQSSEQV
jgi:PAS domain S-box-containing protein